MKVDFYLIGDADLIFLRLTGTASVEGFRAAMAPVFAHPDYRADLPEIADLSGVTPGEMRAPGVQRLVRTAAEAGPTGPTKGKKKIAFFAPEDVAYGMARMFSAMAEIQDTIEARAFRSEAEVLDWLGRPEGCFAQIPGFASCAG